MMRLLAVRERMGSVCRAVLLGVYGADLYTVNLLVYGATVLENGPMLR